MDSLSVRDAAYFEQVSEGGKQKTAGYTIATVIVVFAILAFIVWIFGHSNRNHADNLRSNGDHNCATRERLGILEGEMRSVGTVLNRVVPKLSDLGEFTAAQLGGLNEYTRCADKEFGQLWGSVNRLDNAVFVARCGREGRDGCGRNNGGRRFQERQTFALTGTEVDVIDTCNQG